MNKPSVVPYNPFIMKTVAVACLSLLLVSPAWAGKGQSSGEDFDIEQPFEEIIGKQVLRSLLNQALEVIDDHIEVSGKLRHGESNSGDSGRFELKLYPEGKSRSNEHIGAEGSFRLSPEDGNHELTLRFKSSKDKSKTAQNPHDFL